LGKKNELSQQALPAKIPKLSNKTEGFINDLNRYIGEANEKL
jgi:hypothetical protein